MKRAGSRLAAALVAAPALVMRPLLRELRAEYGLDPDPMAAYRASGYAQRIGTERVGGRQAGWGA